MNNNHPIAGDCWNRIGVRGDRSCMKLLEHTHCRHCDIYANAAGDSMQRTLPEGYQREWAQHFSGQDKLLKKTDLSAIVFQIGSEWFALPSHLTVTIAEVASAHRVPHRTNSSLIGVVNVKAHLYPCMSLASLLGIDRDTSFPRTGRRAYPRLIVLQLGQQQYALPVEDLLGIHQYASTDVQSAPATGDNALHRYLTGVLVIEDLRVGCLDAELLGYNFGSALK